MNQNQKKGKTTLIVLTIICILLIGMSIVGSQMTGPVTGFTGYIITPIQKGMNSLGAFLSGFSTNMTDAASLREENARLQAQVDTLTEENSKLVLNKEELDRLQDLLALKEQYPDYDTVGARVISITDHKGLSLDDPDSTGVPYMCEIAVSTADIRMLSVAEAAGDIRLFATDDSYDTALEAQLQTDTPLTDALEKLQGTVTEEPVKEEVPESTPEPEETAEPEETQT